MKEYILTHNLHSTMVRFIMELILGKYLYVILFTFHYGQIYYLTFSLIFLSSTIIYIPLWLDLLSNLFLNLYSILQNLHSTMVRFIIKNWLLSIVSSTTIYIPLWLDLLLIIIYTKSKVKIYLHSTMVRFIIVFIPTNCVNFAIFTFHYGQIYYVHFYLQKLFVY